MKYQFERVGIVGAGNLATQLARELFRIGYNIVKIYSRTHKNAELLASETNSSATRNPADFAECDLIICAVSDQSILACLSIFAQFAPTVSVSGTIDIRSIDSKYPVGVCYPLQTFSQTLPVQWSEIPFFIESKSDEFKTQLRDFAKSISTTVVDLSAEERLHLHIAAVFINNFTNHMVAIGQSYLAQHQLEMNWLKPLLQQTMHKLEYLPAVDAQTGPARRNDQLTIDNHLNALSESHQKLYKTISESIRTMYSNNDKL